jgi:hypothetical protein
MQDVEMADLKLRLDKAVRPALERCVKTIDPLKSMLEGYKKRIRKVQNWCLVGEVQGCQGQEGY